MGDVKRSLLTSHQSWAKLLPKEQRGVVSCYGSDSRVMVNAELCAASGVYAAGSVAKYPNNDTGHTAVAGEGPISGGFAGRIAAESMIKQYSKRVGKIGTSSLNFIAQNKWLPTCRSDVLRGDIGMSQSSLPLLGIVSLSVGHCDSETMSTHGFWWTNQNSSNKSISRRLSKAPQSKFNEDGKGKYKPIYGSGVIYYLDRSGVIKGVMLWGLPFTDSENELKSGLLNRMKEIIYSNGAVVQTQYGEELGLDQLTSSHLLKESKYLAALATSGAHNNLIISKDKIQNSRPLHRYIAAKPISVTRTGNLKRHELTGHGVAGEDIFDRSVHDNLIVDEIRHPSLVNYYNGGYDSIDDGFSYSISTSLSEKNIEDDHSSRPSKEDPIWLRVNEANRTTSLSEKMNENGKDKYLDDYGYQNFGPYYFIRCTSSSKIVME